MTRFEEIGQEIGRLVAEKNQAYGDSFRRSGAVLREMYPEGIRPEQYGDALAVVRIVDKLFRVATAKDALGESPYRDIAGYGILGAAGVLEPMETGPEEDRSSISQGTLFEQFWGRCIVFDSNYEVRPNDLWRGFLFYAQCRLHPPVFQLQTKKFFNDVRAQPGIGRIRRDGRAYYTGLRLRPEWDERPVSLQEESHA